MPMIDIYSLVSSSSPSISRHMPSTSNYTSTACWKRDRDQQPNMAFSSGIPPFASVEPETRNEVSQPRPSLSAFKSQENISFATHLGHEEYYQPQKSLQEVKEIKRHTTGEDYQKRFQDWNRSDPNIALVSKADSASPRLHRTFNSIGEHDLDALGEEHDEDVAEDISTVDEADIPAENGQTKSSSEQGSDKKKTKRFRLTHNQTRFLMSEFTRQAHPDAAHRERLSREIPGLSPRQVQVWFQNRRAKLKRLTSQDRERMLKSRALPESFDMAQVLHHPYGSRGTSGTPLSSPRTHRSSFTSGSGPQPLVVNIVKRGSGDDYPVSPASATSTYGNYVPSPTSGAASDNLSPTSTTSNRGPIPAPSSSHQASSTFPRSHSFSTAYSHAWQPLSTQRIQLQTSDSRSRADSLNSSLPSGLSYNGNALGNENGGTSVPLTIPSYGRQQSLQSPISQAGPDTASMQASLTYQNEQSQTTQTQPFPRAQQVSDETRGGFTVGQGYRHPTLQTTQIPISQDYQFSPYTPPFNLDSLYPYTQDNSSTISLPTSYMRSEADYDSPNSYHYPVDSEVDKPSGSHPAGT